MKILLFHTENENQILNQLKYEMEKISPDIDIDQCNSFYNFSNYLKDIRKIPNIIVLIIKNIKEFERFDTIKDLIENRPLVIVLSTDKKELFKKVLNFYPRYIGSLDSSYKDTVLVLTKMIDKLQKVA